MEADPDKAIMPVTRAEFADLVTTVTIALANLMEATASVLADDKLAAARSLQEAIYSQRDLVEKFKAYVGASENE